MPKHLLNEPEPPQEVSKLVTRAEDEGARLDREHIIVRMNVVAKNIFK